MRNKTRSQYTFTLPFPSSPAQLHFQYSLTPPPRWCRRQAMGLAVSSPHIVSAAPSSSGEGLLTLFPCSSMGDSPPWTSPAWLLPVGCRSSWTAPAWVASMGCSPSGRGCSSIGPPGGKKSCQQTRSSVGSYFHGSTGAARSLLQHGLSMGPTASFGHPLTLAWGPPWTVGGYLLQHGPPWAAGGQPASPWSSSQAAGEKSLLLCLEHLLPLLLLHWPSCL